MKKILIIRFSSIGDIVLTTPVIRSVREQLNCELQVLTRTRFANLYQNNPYIHKVYAFQENVQEVIPELVRENYDHVVDLQKNLRSMRVRRKLGVSSSSFPKLNKEKWLRVNLHIDRLPHLHVVDRYFDAVSPLGVVNDGRGLDFFIPASEEVMPQDIDPSLADGFVGMVIGSRHETKILPAKKAAAIINLLDYPFVLLGGTEDRERGEAIRNEAPGKQVINTCGNYSIHQSASLVKQAKVIISNDTGLMHIAAALGKPLISVWGNTIPQFGMYPYMPGREQLSVIAEIEGLRCRPCSKLGFKKCPKKHFRCMLDQDAEKIAEHVRNMHEMQDLGVR